jgi:hypothetical protein
MQQEGNKQAKGGGRRKGKQRNGKEKHFTVVIFLTFTEM